MYAKPPNILEQTPKREANNEESPSGHTLNASESKQAYQEYFGKPPIHSSI